jgi:type IVB pilus formation R64 PilN family outer membrane protein
VNPRARRLAGILALCACLPACVGEQKLAAALRRARDGQADAEHRHRAFADAARKQPDAQSQEVARPWLAGRARPVSREVTLPAALRKNVDTTLMFAGGDADLPVLAQRIAKATGVPVRVRPDALLPPEMFLPRLATAAQPQSLGLPTRARLPEGPQPLPRVLDQLAWRLGVSWRYDGDAIDFFRTETRVFDVRALAVAARADARLGRSGAGAGQGFENTSQTSISTGDYDAVAAIRSRIEPFLTRAGVIAAAPAAGGSIVITDTRDALDAVARFLDRENRILTRRVRLVFEEITVVMKDQAQAGIDWNLVYASARAGARVATTGLGALAGSAAAGALSGGVPASAAAGAFQSSQAIVSALSELGTVVRHSSVPVLTLNRRPVTHAVRTTFSYIDQVQNTSAILPAQTSSVSAFPSVSVSQKQETVGSFLTLLPDAQENGQILVSVAYDNTVAQPLKTILFGEEGRQLQIQQVTIDGNGTVQQVQLSAGQPMVISGFDRRSDEYDRRRLAPDAPLITGGLNRAASERATTVVIVTAQLEDDA